MKSIKENWDAFAEPMKQALENARHIPEHISDTVLDKMDEMKNASSPDENEETPPPKKKGCLKKILVYGFAVLVIITFFKNGCSFNSTIERDAAEQGQSAAPSQSETMYDTCIKTSEANIAALIAQEPMDLEALEEEFEFLLSCKMSEYVFKVMACGHFTGDYETTKYDSILDDCGAISEELHEHFDAETAEGLYSYVAIMATEEYDDEVFDYDSYLIGSTEDPDIDTMWYTYFDTLVGAKG